MNNHSYTDFTSKEKIVGDFFTYIISQRTKNDINYNKLNTDTLTALDGEISDGLNTRQLEIQEITNNNLPNVEKWNNLPVDVISAFFFKDKNGNESKRNGNNVPEYRKRINLSDNDIEIKKEGKVLQLPDEAILLYHYDSTNSKSKQLQDISIQPSLEEKISFLLEKFFNVEIKSLTKEQKIEKMKNELNELSETKEIVNYFKEVNKNNSEETKEEKQQIKMDYLFTKIFNISSNQSFIPLDAKKLKLFFKNNSSNLIMVNDKEKQSYGKFNMDIHESAYSTVKISDLKNNNINIQSEDIIPNNQKQELKQQTMKF